MNKKTAVISGILVMIGAATAVGIVAYTTEQSGMIKKGISQVRPGRMEYAQHQETPMILGNQGVTPLFELSEVNTALKNVLSNPAIKMLTPKERTKMKEQFEKDWTSMNKRHATTQDSKELTYKRLKEQTEPLYQQVLQILQ